jgi:hypothetical protein
MAKKRKEDVVIAFDKTEVNAILETITSFKVIKDHLHHARSKHPEFTDILDDEGVDGRSIHLDNNRYYLRWLTSNKRLDAYAVMECELDEFFDALHRGKRREAMHELLDLFVVGLRLMYNDKGLVKWEEE